MTKQTDESRKSELLHEVGAIIVRDPSLEAVEWEALAFVVQLHENSRGGRARGYRYSADGSFEPEAPGEIIDLTLALSELRDEMEAETGKRWKTVLIHLTKPGPEINMTFEYDDPDRWKLEIKKGLDVSDYANSIKPPM